MSRDIPVLGVCLGAQLIANVLGAKVIRNQFKEIGWFPVALTEQGRHSRLTKGFPDEFTAFHWHGDVFEIPLGADSLAFSDACRNQIFTLEKVIGLQFHLETMPTNAMDLCVNCKDELVSAPYVQSTETILTGKQHFKKIHGLMQQLLTNAEELAVGG